MANRDSSSVEPIEILDVDDASTLTENLGLEGVTYLCTRNAPLKPGSFDNPVYVSDTESAKGFVSDDSVVAVKGNRKPKPPILAKSPTRETSQPRLPPVTAANSPLPSKSSSMENIKEPSESPPKKYTPQKQNMPIDSVQQEPQKSAPEKKHKKVPVTITKQSSPIRKPKKKAPKTPSTLQTRPSKTTHRHKTDLPMDLSRLSQEAEGDEEIEKELEEIALSGRSGMIGGVKESPSQDPEHGAIEHGPPIEPKPPVDPWLEPPVDSPLDDEKSFVALANSTANKPNRRVWYLFMAAVGLLAISGGLLYTLLSKNSKKGEEAALDSRQQSIQNILERMVTREILTDPTTSQYKARKWILFEDDNIQDVTEERVIQRYSLASFFFATDGENSWYGHNWMEGSECDTDNTWKGLDCNSNGEIRVVFFDNEGLSGSIPNEIGHLSKLESLILKNNPGLQGSIPSTMGHLGRSLKQLGLYRNALTGTIPDVFVHTTELQFINLEGNKLWGSIPVSVGKLHKLDTLVLSENKLDGVVPIAQLGKTSIKYLGLSHNRFSSIIERQIQDLGSLEHLYLDNNQLRGKIPSTMGSLTQLRSIDLGNNQFTGLVPTELGLLRNLEFLSVNSNALHGPLPKQLGLLTGMKVLNFATNQLTGSLPHVANMVHLINLQLFENRFSGTIPEGIQQLQSIEVLFLSSNKLTGAIPRGIERLSRTLKGLYLSGNSIQGRIPTEICALNSLEALFLDSNLIYGKIPTCLGELEELRQMYVFDNKLTGEIPSSLQELRNLEGLGLEKNDITGEMPDEVCGLVEEFGTGIWADCTDKFGTDAVLCSCCEVCCPGSDCT